MNVFPITDIPEFSKKRRIVVVGIIGKSPYRYPNKATPLISNVQTAENGIECHWDERRSILYLHAVTYLDTKRLTTLAASLNEEESESADQRLILQTVFDLGYLQLFKAIDAYRTEQIGRSTEALLNIKATGAWKSHGRCCCPRLLFHFRRAPNPLKKAPAALKRLEHAVEDQLYFILRKARIITKRLLPSAPAWREAAQALCGVYLAPVARAQDEPASSALYDALATDVRFSQARCAKVSVALGVLDSMARGPLSRGARARLSAACAAIWRTRSLCEALSLTGHVCIEPEQAAALKEAEEAAERALSRRSPAGSGVSPASAASADNNWSAPDALSPGSARDDDDDDKSHDSDRYVVPVRGDAATEKTMSRQPSTTEYLPGMLHSQSPAGLLPAFASWSLVCLGASSLYSHALGLPEHLQPGFLPHTNYLLPWDCAVQPVPGGPIFVPQPVGSPPIKLSASAYWVLRFPYMYSDERGCLPRPRPGVPHQSGTIITPLFGLQD
ncbi:hypothetical protein HF086_005584 [Spodoptera exigua]|uniref:Nonsense-mediated mRNA decay factor SMG8 n=1 Tax=Spodoptera exigua TaxID=7107 RepID=A0A922MY86_SPOEX|nr:hypothetical protein HF086_005584 [Spodoptera exigua]